MTHLLVNLSFFQTGYLLPPQVSITIQAPERSVTIFKKALLRWVSGSRITQLPQKQVNLLDAVGKEVRLVCLYNDNIEEVSPLFPHHVCHSFIPAHRKKKKLFFSTAACCESEGKATAATSFCLYLHKTERTVGDEEKLLSMTGQFMQNSICLISSQDEFILRVKTTEFHSVSLDVFFSALQSF